MAGKRTIRIAYAVMILIGAALITVVFTLFFSPFSLFEARDIPMDITVSNYTGFNVDNDSIHFGTLMRGSSGSRNITITNNRSSSCSITTHLLGDLSKWVSVSEREFIVDSHKSAVITVRVSVPYTAEFGNYTGTLRFVSTRGCLS